MKKISVEVLARWLLLYSTGRITEHEMLEHFKNYYGFEGNFQQLIEELMILK